jgi:hypothetical protein
VIFSSSVFYDPFPLITSTFDTDRNLVLIKISGDISVAELVEGYDPIISHPDFKVNMPAIWDLSGLDLKKIPISEIRQLPRELRKYMDRRGEYKAALVTSRSTDYQLMRMYVSILKLIGTNIKFRLYKSLDEAYCWVGE